MHRDSSLAQRRVEIVDPHGFHMRHANEFVQLSRRYQSEVWILHEGTRYNDESILDLMNTAVAWGSRSDLEARGSDADATVNALADLIMSGHVIPVLRTMSTNPDM